MAKEILVIDGAEAWIADVAELAQVMARHGWTVGAVHHTGGTEIAQPASDDSLQPYTDLCQDVQPLRDTADDDHGSMPELYLCCGIWVADSELIDELQRQ